MDPSAGKKGPSFSSNSGNMGRKWRKVSGGKRLAKCKQEKIEGGVENYRKYKKYGKTGVEWQKEVCVLSWRGGEVGRPAGLKKGEKSLVVFLILDLAPEDGEAEKLGRRRRTNGGVFPFFCLGNEAGGSGRILIFFGLDPRVFSEKVLALAKSNRVRKGIFYLVKVGGGTGFSHGQAMVDGKRETLPDPVSF